jgi:hypothetical protein
LAFFLGDQVYNDLPFWSAPDADEAAIAQDIEQKYVKNWIRRAISRGARLLRAALRRALVFQSRRSRHLNNYPLFQPHLKNTWTPGRRAAWKSAALRMYSMFQLHHGAPVGQPYVIDDINPLSILVADTRTNRTAGTIFDAAATATINAADALAREPDRFGVLITGQSLFDQKSGAFDKNLLDFASDYVLLVRALQRAVAKRPVLCITGDVHYGRILTQGPVTSAVSSRSSPRLPHSSMIRPGTRRRRSIRSTIRCGRSTAKRRTSPNNCNSPRFPDSSSRMRRRNSATISPCFRSRAAAGR